MEEGTKLDLTYIRHERSQNTPRAVIRRAMQVRNYLRPQDEGHAEATVHLAWAYSKTGRENEAIALYQEVIARLDDPSTAPTDETLLPYAIALADCALLLSNRGQSEEAYDLVRRALIMASTSHNDAVINVVTAAAAEIATGPPHD